MINCTLKCLTTDGSSNKIIPYTHESATKGLSIDFDVDRTNNSVGELKSLNCSDIHYHLYFFSYVHLCYKDFL